MTTSKNNLEAASVPPPVVLAVSGMTCGNCAQHVTKAIQAVSGVQSASANLDAEVAIVRWSPGAAINVPAVIQAVEAAGYGAKIDETAVLHEHTDCCGGHGPTEVSLRGSLQHQVLSDEVVQHRKSDGREGHD